MKRDMDLCRKILLDTEAAPFAPATEVEAEGFSHQEVSFHIMLLQEAGLLKGVDFTAVNGEHNWCVERLTWEGYEFLDAARDNKRWAKAKDVMTKVGGLSLPVLVQLLTSYLKAELNLP